MVGLKLYDRKANMSMRFVVKNVHRKTRTKAFTEIHAIRCKNFSDSGIYFDTNFEMINVVSIKMVKNMLLRYS